MPLKKPQAGFYILNIGLVSVILFFSWVFKLNPTAGYDSELKIADIYSSQGQRKLASEKYDAITQTLLQAQLLSYKKAFYYLIISWNINPKPLIHGEMLVSIFTRAPLKDILEDIAKLQQDDPLLLEAMMLANQNKPVYLNVYADNWSQGKDAACFVKKDTADSLATLVFNYEALPKSFFPVTLTLKSPSSTHPNVIIQKIITSPKKEHVSIPLSQSVSLITITADKDFTPKGVRWDNSIRRLGFSYTASVSRKTPETAGQRP
jgi:hypothetical protein